MAEKNKELNDGDLSFKECPIPSNEDIIDELTKDLDSCSMKTSGDECKSVCGKTKTVEKNLTQSETVNDSEEHSDSGSKLDNEEDSPEIEDDFIDEEMLKNLEVTYSEDEKEKLRAEAEKYKSEGNDYFKAGNCFESARSYTLALRTCPLAYEKDRAIMFSNRAAAKMKLGSSTSAIEDCSKAIELDSRYLKAYFRRAKLYEETEKLDEALADYQKILELDPLHREALYASKRLPEQIHERNEKMKTEMMGKLKDLGNLILRPFGLSTDNFQLNQDPNSGGYSINFQQTPR